MTNRSTFYYRVAAAVLALLGLGPFITLGISSGDWSVLRLTVIDPLVVVALCLGVAFAFPERMRALGRRALDSLRRVPRPALLAVAGVFVVVASCLVSWTAYLGQPVYTDEYTQAFQGRVLLSGHLSARSEMYPEFFGTVQTMHFSGRWFGEYPILSAVTAALGDAIGAGWLINPVLLGIGALAMYFFARRAYDETTARLALVLVALSPFAIFMGATRMSHVPALTLTAIAFACLVRWESQPRYAIGVGLSLGLMALFRPYDAFLVALPIGVLQLVMLWRQPSRARSIGLQVVVAMAVVAIQLWVNARTTGNALLFGYDALNGPAHRPGFHVDPLGFTFTPAKGFDLLVRYLSRLNTSLFESVVPAVAFLVVGMWLTRPSKWDWLLAGLCFSVFAGYGAYWADGTFSSPRFLSTAMIAFIVLTARFVVLIGARARESRAALGGSLVLPLCFVLAFVPSSVGQRSTGIWLRLDGLERNTVVTQSNPTADAKKQGLTNALVFLREPTHRRITARLRALGMRPFTAERTAADMDACGLLAGLAKSDAIPDVPLPPRLQLVLDIAAQSGPTRVVPGLVGASALSLSGHRLSPECLAEIDGDRNGVESLERLLAVSNFDKEGRLTGDVIFARYLGARDSILRTDPRFASRKWYLYHRNPDEREGRFEVYER